MHKGKIRKMGHWNNGILEYWVDKKPFGFFTLFHHSIIPLFQNHPLEALE
jgi:hypothetical protein